MSILVWFGIYVVVGLLAMFVGGVMVSVSIWSRYGDSGVIDNDTLARISEGMIETTLSYVGTVSNNKTIESIAEIIAWPIYLVSCQINYCKYVKRVLAELDKIIYGDSN